MKKYTHYFRCTKGIPNIRRNFKAALGIEMLSKVEADIQLQSWTGGSYIYKLDETSAIEVPDTQPLTQPIQAESENHMKITVNRENLIQRMQAFVDAEQAKHQTATATHEAAIAPVRALVEANKSGIAKRLGQEEIGGSKLMATATEIATLLGIPSTAPVLPATVATTQKNIQTLSLSTSPELEMEDNSPYLQCLV